ncbi:hypothetical protein CPB83DRAFT_895953 [Crepidotus variabilis]|uniref:Uncharacterized protein n=1 Tax=Crepidotus variabilis TaxID=179855 RepID=A0A9P6JNF0_9AGAR|nr:hypothetical protein CPB83DRAFT_895953 [Crepidotus variabilis]
MSSPSFSPITTPLDALHATDELNVDKLLESSPPPEDDEPEEDTILASPNGEVSTTIGGESDINSDAMATGTGVLATGHSLRSELVRARRACERNKLSPYQVEQIESFTKTSPLARDVDVRVELSAIRNLLAAIVAAIPPFAVKGPLAENLRSYSMAVLLSSKLSAYKGNVPRDLVYVRSPLIPSASIPKMTCQ